MTDVSQWRVEHDRVMASSTSSEVLQLPQGSVDADAARKSFYRLASILHPDASGDSLTHESFCRVKQAFDDVTNVDHCASAAMTAEARQAAALFLGSMLLYRMQATQVVCKSCARPAVLSGWCAQCHEKHRPRCSVCQVILDDCDGTVCGACASMQVMRRKCATFGCLFDAERLGGVCKACARRKVAKCSEMGCWRSPTAGSQMCKLHQ